VTGPASNQCRVRVSSANDSSVNDISDANFSINEPPPPPPGGCAAKTAVQGTPREANTLTLLYRFRDRVLSKSARGQQYIAQFYQFSPEAVSLMVSHPALLFQTREMLRRFMPVIQSVIDRQAAKITQTDLMDIDRFLTAYAAQGSSEFRRTIKQLKRDLRDRQVQSEFGITVSH